LEASIAERPHPPVSGKKGVVTRAKKAMRPSKIREGMPFGVAVTLRGQRMYAFRSA